MPIMTALSFLDTVAVYFFAEFSGDGEAVLRPMQ